jgi:hypothetical protein
MSLDKCLNDVSPMIEVRETKQGAIMPGETSTQIPRSMVEVIELTRTAVQAEKEVREAFHDHTNRLEAGETTNTFKVLPKESILFARQQVPIPGPAGDEDRPGVGWRQTEKVRPITSEAPFVAASWAVSIWNGQAQFVFWDQPKHRDANGELPQAVWQLGVDINSSVSVELQEIDASGAIVSKSVIGEVIDQGVELIDTPLSA